MTLQEELLKEDYNVGIYAPEFDGDTRGSLSFHKEIDAENYLINDSNPQTITNELWNLIESKIEVYYE